MGKAALEGIHCSLLSTASTACLASTSQSLKAACSAVEGRAQHQTPYWAGDAKSVINEHEPVRTVQMPAPRWGETIERRQGGQTNSHPTGERVQIAFVKEFHLYLLPNSICICQPIAFVLQWMIVHPGPVSQYTAEKKDHSGLNLSRARRYLLLVAGYLSLDNTRERLVGHNRLEQEKKAWFA